MKKLKEIKLTEKQKESLIGLGLGTAVGAGMLFLISAGIDIGEVRVLLNISEENEMSEEILKGIVSTEETGIAKAVAGAGLVVFGMCGFISEALK